MTLSTPLCTTGAPSLGQPTHTAEKCATCWSASGRSVQRYRELLETHLAPVELEPAPVLSAVAAPVIDQGGITVRLGHALDELRLLPDASVEAVITDPPYELGFMGKSWDNAGIAYSVELWAECLRVLRPGGHLAAFGGSRTYHRMACAVEDAGFEIRDSLTWLYGSGFPKSANVGAGIMKRQGLVPTEDDWTPEAEAWRAFGTALKPAQEPIVLARKPLQGTVAANVLTHGVGGLNIDATRVAATAGDIIARAARNGSSADAEHDSGYHGAWSGRERRTDIGGGRWPSNVLLSHGEECADVCAPGCPVAELDAQSEGTRAAKPSGTGSRSPSEFFGLGVTEVVNRFSDSGGASRFFPTFRYQAKAPSKERPKVDGIAHPTVKPLALMRWLVRLLCPPGGLVLDPFAGSGTTLQAARDEGMSAVGIEREADYLPLIAARLGVEL